MKTLAKLSWFIAFTLIASGCAATANSDLRNTFAGNKAQAMTEEHYGDGTIRKATPRWSTDYFESRER
jgi:hypothetical protein